MAAMQEDFFADTAMIGISTAAQGYRLCWLLNRHFDINFERDPDQNLSSRKKEKEYYFPIYHCPFPNSNHKYSLYKLKNGTETLLPEAKQLDYVWMVQTANPELDAMDIVRELRNIPEVQLATVLASDQLKNLNNLLT